MAKQRIFGWFQRDFRALKAIAPVVAGLAAFMALPAQASNINVTVTSFDEYVDYYSAVTLIGPGGGTVNYIGVPGEGWSGDQGDALAAALADLGLSAATPLTDIIASPQTTFSTFEEIVDANGAVYGVDYIGDPNNYQTWIAIGLNDVFVDVDQIVTYFTPYLLTATISEPISEVPLPAGAFLFLTGLGLTALRRRGSTAS